jgi:tetratricopeptide (TPR) repeat protein
MTSVSPETSEPPSPLSRVLGLSPRETDLLGRLFVDTLAKSGISGGPIFERLKGGASIGEALSVPPDVARLLYARAHRWFSAGRPDRAEPLFRVLAVIDGANADNWAGWGICLRIAERWAEAETAFATAAALRRDWSVPHFHAIELHIRRGNWAEAQKSLQAYEQCGASGATEAMTRELDRFRAALDLNRQAVAR